MSSPKQFSRQAIVDDYLRLFVNRMDVTLRWRQHWYIDRRPHTPALIERALVGSIPLGVAAVSGTGTARWICWDSDRDDRVGALIELYRLLPAQARLFETSRRGAHLWLFHRSIDWRSAHHYGQHLADEVGLEGIEIFPKHQGIHGVRFPGMIHPKSGLRHPLIDPETGETLDLGEALGAIEPTTLTPVEPPAAAFGSRHSRASSRSSTELIDVLSAVTTIRQYAPGNASGLCPWHEDTQPSLYVKGGRFRCLACGVWGDVWDVRRWSERGIPPPQSL